MIEVANLTKQYGNKLAVDGSGLLVQTGNRHRLRRPERRREVHDDADDRRTGRADRGPGFRHGRDYRSAAAPMSELGVLLEAKAVHTGRSARNRRRR
ncbi:MAG TPA: hypothetical protein VFC03_22580 [Acidimicrobiales bacterium]|nr:hypothetical protein [Acidimicrobiales bacterium]